MTKRQYHTRRNLRGVRRVSPESWRVVVREGAATRGLGTFRSEHEAAEAYDRWAIQYYGATALLNCPEKRPMYLLERANGRSEKEDGDA